MKDSPMITRLHRKGSEILKYLYLVMAIVFMAEGIGIAIGSVVPTVLVSSLNALLLGLCFLQYSFEASYNKLK